jgi:hypothetical protein
MEAFVYGAFPRTFTAISIPIAIPMTTTKMTKMAKAKATGKAKET